jgi:hypothetical protein
MLQAENPRENSTFVDGVLEAHEGVVFGGNSAGSGGAVTPLSTFCLPTYMCSYIYVSYTYR